MGIKILDGTYSADSIQDSFIIEKGRTQAKPKLGNKALISLKTSLLE